MPAQPPTILPGGDPERVASARRKCGCGPDQARLQQGLAPSFRRRFAISSLYLSERAIDGRRHAHARVEVAVRSGRRVRVSDNFTRTVCERDPERVASARRKCGCGPDQARLQQGLEPVAVRSMRTCASSDACTTANYTAGRSELCLGCCKYGDRRNSDQGEKGAFTCRYYIKQSHESYGSLSTACMCKSVASARVREGGEGKFSSGVGSQVDRVAPSCCTSNGRRPSELRSRREGGFYLQVLHKTVPRIIWKLEY
jgi:hypothetical protein